ncbi:hypothetical protein [Hymenobacter sp. PAMC 26628]|uniref:hypothetical protein n=1 Tax=Hymenobacter sp. PAMC 26628 TaxID=1484118 RepID=UPI0007703A23|nr:hypothetical protein [Hymenobacter sp. PAMC 26628]AMJ65592.1 hypothetical protein AXW84_09225 [Hymenobacter sp. PAMC 26628]
MNVRFAITIGWLLLSGCAKSKTDLDARQAGADDGWHSPTTRLHLVVPSKYGPAQDLVAIVFHNPDTMKVRYRFQIRRYTGARYVLIANDHTTLLPPHGAQQINYSTLPTGRYDYKKDALRVLLTNEDTHQNYGEFLLTQ